MEQCWIGVWIVLVCEGAGSLMDHSENCICFDCRQRGYADSDTSHNPRFTVVYREDQYAVIGGADSITQAMRIAEQHAGDTLTWSLGGIRNRVYSNSVTNRPLTNYHIQEEVR